MVVVLLLIRYLLFACFCCGLILFAFLYCVLLFCELWFVGLSLLLFVCVCFCCCLMIYFGFLLTVMILFYCLDCVEFILVLFCSLFSLFRLCLLLGYACCFDYALLGLLGMYFSVWVIVAGDLFTFDLVILFVCFNLVC